MFTFRLFVQFLIICNKKKFSSPLMGVSRNPEGLSRTCRHDMYAQYTSPPPSGETKFWGRLRQFLIRERERGRSEETFSRPATGRLSCFIKMCCFYSESGKVSRSHKTLPMLTYFQRNTVPITAVVPFPLTATALPPLCTGMVFNVTGVTPDSFRST